MNAKEINNEIDRLEKEMYILIERCKGAIDEYKFNIADKLMSEIEDIRFYISKLREELLSFDSLWYI